MPTNLSTMTRQQKEQLVLAKREKKIRSSRTSFWSFCKTLSPEFYKDNRPHLRNMCDTLQNFYEGKLLKPDNTPYKNIMINLPPQHGKSRTLIMFTAWIMGIDNNERTITCSYNDDLATDFSKYTRNTIQQDKQLPEDIVYSDIFPNTKIKQGDSSYKKWALEGKFFSYLGAGIGAGITGKSGTCFPEGTMIKTIDGNVDIVRLTNKDNHFVLSYNHECDTIEEKRIVATKRRISHELIEISTESGFTIRCTPDHPIWNGERYIEARLLQQGDKVYRVNMSHKTPCLSTDTISSIKRIEEECYVYDIEVEDNHNFFANDILVHNCRIVDDLVKDKATAFNEDALKNIWSWFTDTFLSRRGEGDIKTIMCMTRWADKDPCGMILNGPTASEWYIMKVEVYNEVTGEMLCPAILSYADYKGIELLMDPLVFRANYHQETMDAQGKLYTILQEYDTLPEKIERIINYTDTADEGSDYLASIIAAQYKGQLYILDIYYTKEAMEITEPEVAKRLFDLKCTVAHIESNNGGRGFARTIERLLWDTFKSRLTKINWFHQSANKKARILSNATNVMNNIFFPLNWRHKFPEAYNHLNTYHREGKNKHDDIEDCLTGLWEKSQTTNKWVTA